MGYSLLALLLVSILIGVEAQAWNGRTAAAWGGLLITMLQGRKRCSP